MKIDDLNYEEAYERLEEIIRLLEAGELGLDESLKKYEEGIRLYRKCNTILEEANIRVEKISKNGYGDIKKQEFSLEEE